MKAICREIQERLAEGGAAALRDDAGAQRHVEECTACFEVLERLAALDAAMAGMPALDAPEPVVVALLEKVRAGGEDRPGVLPGTVAAAGRPPQRFRFVGWVAAASVAATVLFVLLPAAFWLRRPGPEVDEPTVPLIIQVPPAASPAPVAAAAPPVPPAPEPAKRKQEATAGSADEPTDSLQAHGYSEPHFNAVDQLKAEGDEFKLLDQRPRSLSEAVGLPDSEPPRLVEQPRKNELSKTAEEKPAIEGNKQTELPLANRPFQDLSRLPAEQETQAAGQRQKKDLADKEEKRKETERDDYAGADRRAAVGVEDGVAGGVEGGVAGGVLGGVVGGLSEGRVDGPTSVNGQPESGVVSLDGDMKVGGKAGALRVGGRIAEPRRLHYVAPKLPEVARHSHGGGVVVVEVTVDARGRVTATQVLSGPPFLTSSAVDAVKQWRYAPTLLNGVPVPVMLTVTVRFESTRRVTPTPRPRPTPVSSQPLSDPARAFLEERGTTDGLSFRTPTGYWANTYLPGDPALRLLAARLRAWDRSALEASLGPLRLHEALAPAAPPLDAPHGGALALSVNADRRGIDGPRRMLVQVALRAATRSGAPRPPMSVALVLDLRGRVATETGADMRALALALAPARQPGDRFHLIFAGRPGDAGLTPEAYRHGPVAVALDRALSGASEGGLSLTDAVASAYRAVCSNVDRDAVLGSSAVLLVTGQSIGADVSTVSDFAHQGAVAGVPLTAIGVGDGARPDELQRLALAGQGSRRVLETRGEARRLIDDELAGTSQPVARAVRLRIRLAKGVQLVDVVGSHSLDEVQTARVREAEKSVDLQLARQMGLAADRGDDEDGIQIVVPVFRAADTHTVLLDVVAPGAGAIADVQVRYKDLVSLGNGTARASLTLAPGERPAGPLERAVVADLLMHRVSEALAQAGDALAGGDAAGAASRVTAARDLLAGVATTAGLERDRGISQARQVLDAYARVLAASLDGTQRAAVTDSLRYASRLLQLSRPPSGAV